MSQGTCPRDSQLLADEAEDILLITDDGTIIRVPVGSISTLGRNTLSFVPLVFPPKCD